MDSETFRTLVNAWNEADVADREEFLTRLDLEFESVDLVWDLELEEGD